METFYRDQRPKSARGAPPLPSPSAPPRRALNLPAEPQPYLPVGSGSGSAPPSADPVRGTQAGSVPRNTSLELAVFIGAVLFLFSLAIVLLYLLGIGDLISNPVSGSVVN